MKTREEILDAKFEYYGQTRAAMEFAMREYADQSDKIKTDIIEKRDKHILDLIEQNKSLLQHQKHGKMFVKVLMMQAALVYADNKDGSRNVQTIVNEVFDRENDDNDEWIGKQNNKRQQRIDELERFVMRDGSVIREQEKLIIEYKKALKTIVEFTDLEMGDGDGARELAEKILEIDKETINISLPNDKIPNDAKTHHGHILGDGNTYKFYLEGKLVHTQKTDES